ncbi:MAG: prolyl-tRNA synthetase associated domain-containing protein [Candidatus Shapirobacteria bacterium]|jgi:Ala-tRNA(Pro) deacylase
MTVEEYLTGKGIKFEVYEHPAVFTCEEAEAHSSNIPGLASKNLLLNNSKKTRFFLVILPAIKRLDLKMVEQLTGEKHLSFASPETLKLKLGLTPGAVSPFGLINNQDKDVELIVDLEVKAADRLSFHPNRNTASVSIEATEFGKFLESVGVKPQIM